MRSFEIDPAVKRNLLEGLDAIGLTMEHEDENRGLRGQAPRPLPVHSLRRGALMSQRGRHPRPSPVWYWRNWYYSTIEFMERTRIAAGNHWLKLRRLEGCCGNYGQPGC